MIVLSKTGLKQCRRKYFPKAITRQLYGSEARGCQEVDVVGVSFQCRSQLPFGLSSFYCHYIWYLHPRTCSDTSTWRRLCSRQYVYLLPMPPTASHILRGANARLHRVLHRQKDALRHCAPDLPTLMQRTPPHRRATARDRHSLTVMARFHAT